MSTAKLYLRLSKDEAGQTSIADQERECRRLADRLGITDIVVYCEQPGTSGFKDVARPVFDDLLAGLSNGDVVLAWAIDRLTRKGMEQAGTILRVCEERGAAVVTVSDGVDTRHDGAELNVGMRAIMAREYSKGLSKNVRRGKETGAALGIWNGGPRWYGYATDADGVWRGPKALDDTEAKVLHEVRDRYVAGEPMYRITADLNERGIPTSTGKAWKTENLLRLLLNKRYIGVRTHNGTEYPGNWPAVFTPEERAELEAAKCSTERMKCWPSRPTGTRTYLLSGFLSCPCGGKLRGAGKDKGQGFKRLYRCSTCHHTMRSADPLEHLVTEAVLFRLDSPELGKLLTQSSTDDGLMHSLTSEIEAKSLALQRLADDYTDGVFDRAEYMRQKQRVTAAKEAAESRLQRELAQRTNLHLNVGETLRSAFTTRRMEWQRRLIGLVISDIQVLPTDAHMKNSELYAGRWRFKPADVRINWIA